MPAMMVHFHVICMHDIPANSVVSGMKTVETRQDKQTQHAAKSQHAAPTAAHILRFFCWCLVDAAFLALTPLRTDARRCTDRLALRLTACVCLII